MNKNFELFYAMYISTNVDSMLMANKYSGFPLVTRENFELKKNFYKKFTPYKDCSQVKFYNQLASKGFVFGAPFNTLLHVDTSLNITDSCFFENLPFPQSQKKEVKESVYMFIKQLKEFSDLSGFENFYRQNEHLYDTIIKIHNEKAPLQYLVSSIEDFFGWGLKSYHVVLVPMMWPGGISLDYSRNCADSLTEINICLGPKSVESGIPYFGTDEEYKSVIIHEFVHPFIMRYCMKYRKQIEKYSALYDIDENVYKINGCPDWFSAINEVLTRTVEIIISSENDSQTASEAVEFQSGDLGFSLIPSLYKAFEEYYNPRNRAETNIDAVFLNIINSLETVLRENDEA